MRAYEVLGRVIAGSVVAVSLTALIGCVDSGGPLTSSVVPGPTRSAPASSAPASSTTLLFGGDVMLGRSVASANASDPAAVLRDLRPQLAAADLALANLESPLTLLRHTSANPNALEADPALADVLARVGFGAMSVANNHVGDEGAASVSDTLDALGKARVLAVGAGRNAAQAYAPVVVERNGIRIALLAFDATGQGSPASSTTAGVAVWDRVRMRAAVAEARSASDLVAVSVHGGAEYHFGEDPQLSRIASELALWGADVVWCHGPHVVQPTAVIDPDKDGRPTVVAGSLGNLLFDQSIPGTTQGALLEVRANKLGVFAYRIGITDTKDRRVSFVRWEKPQGAAVALDGEWYSPTRAIDRWSVAPKPMQLPKLPAIRRVDAAAVGDANGDGRDEVVVSYRSPFHVTRENSRLPANRWTDPRGLASHLGLYEAGTLRPLWVAGTVARPVSAIAPGGSEIAVGYTALDATETVATALWLWRGFGFITAEELPGPGTPGLADVDGDGQSEPVVMGRGAR